MSLFQEANIKWVLTEELSHLPAVNTVSLATSKPQRFSAAFPISHSHAQLWRGWRIWGQIAGHFPRLKKMKSWKAASQPYAGLRGNVLQEPAISLGGDSCCGCRGVESVCIKRVVRETPPTLRDKRVSTGRPQCSLPVCPSSWAGWSGGGFGCGLNLEEVATLDYVVPARTQFLLLRRKLRWGWFWHRQVRADAIASFHLLQPRGSALCLPRSCST
jgi:hypothetical protein